MKSKFDAQRLSESVYDFGKKGRFPIYYVKPVKKDCKDLIVFVTGLNGNAATVGYFNFKVFDNYHLLSMDNRAQADNLSTPSRRWKTYLKDIHNIIAKFKQEHDIERVFLTGESWGAALSTLYTKYYDDVDGFFVWNMPCKVINTSKDKGMAKVKRDLKMICTYLTNKYWYWSFNIWKD